MGKSEGVEMKGKNKVVASLGREENRYKDKVIETLIEALQFYADKHSWLLNPMADVARDIIGEDCDNVQGYARHCGGRVAREALDKIETLK